MCKICQCDNNSCCSWVLGETLLDKLGPLRETADEVSSRDWVCDKCFSSIICDRI